MPCADVRKGDVGVLFRNTIKDQNDTIVDISGATYMRLNFKKPLSSVLLSVTPVFSSGGTDGRIQYASVSGDLDEVGVYEMQAYIEIGSGNYHSDIKRFRVERVLG